MSVQYAIPQRTGVLVGEELVTPGVEAATIDIVLGDIISANGLPKIDSIPYRTMGGGRKKHNIVGGLRHYGIEIEMYIVTGNFLQYVTEDLAESGAGPEYTHTLTFDDTASLQHLTIEDIVSDLTRSFKYLGQRCNTMKISSAVGELMKAELAFVGMGIDKEESPSTPAVLTGEPFKYEHGEILVDAVDYKDVLQSFEYNLNHNIYEAHAHNQSIPHFVSEGKLDHELSVEVFAKDSLLYDLADLETEFALQFKGVKTASEDEFTLNFPKCKTFEFEEPHNTEDELIRQTIPIEVITNPTFTVIDAIQNW